MVNTAQIEYVDQLHEGIANQIAEIRSALDRMEIDLTASIVAFDSGVLVTVGSGRQVHEEVAWLTHNLGQLAGFIERGERE